MNRRVVLFTGMGADGRLLAPLQTPGIDIFAPDHLQPLPGEPLADYALRVSAAHSIGDSDIIGGASFGGMLAAEIAKQRRVAGLILLGSCLDPRLLPSSYRFAEKYGHVVPDFLLNARSFRPLLRWRFAPVTREAERIIVSMARDCPPAQIREFGRMIVHWAGVESLSCPVLSIHGDNDRIIPLSAAVPGKILPRAGHCFTLTHAEETIAEIRAFLSAACYT